MFDTTQRALCRSNLLFKSSDGFGGHTKPVKCMAAPAKNLSSTFFVSIVERRAV